MASYKYQVIVLYGETDRFSMDIDRLINHKPVASFIFNTDEVGSEEDAAELAFRYTQNLCDSWSETSSKDSHPSLHLMQARPVYDGVEYGHRSSMVGDLFIITDLNGKAKTFRCAMCGFVEEN